jgi:predicted Rossmann-fold nucleotide-binding protein
MGVIPGHPQEDGRCETHPDYPNEWIELPIYTHLPDSGSRGWDASSRNHINVLTSTVVVALPGSDGTKSEVHLAVQYGRPVIAFLGEGSIPDLPDEVSVAKSLDEVKAFIDSAIA